MALLIRPFYPEYPPACYHHLSLLLVEKRLMRHLPNLGLGPFSRSTVPNESRQSGRTVLGV